MVVCLCSNHRTTATVQNFANKGDEEKNKAEIRKENRLQTTAKCDKSGHDMVKEER